MKKILAIAVLAFGLSSYTVLSSEYRMNPTEEGQDSDETVVVTNSKTGEAKVATLCPGTGQSCVIHYTLGDGSGATYVESKGKGKADIEF